MAAVDDKFQEDRLHVSAKVQMAAERAWLDRVWHDRSTFTDRVIPIVEGGIGAIVAMTNAYMNHKASISAGEDIAVQVDVHPEDVSIESLRRGVTALEVYSRPFGALGHHLEQGETFPSADDAAAAYVKKLVETDMQLAFITACNLWVVLYGVSI